MKIAFVIHSLHDKSGTQRVACHLANLFVEKLNYQVTILNRDTDFEQVAYTLHSSVQVISLSGGYSQFYSQLQHYIQNNQPDFMVVHNMGRLSLLCAMLNKQYTKLVSLEHVAFESRPVWVKFLSKVCYKKINTVICLTKNDKKNYQNWFDDVQVIYNISPFSQVTTIKQNDKKIISVGRLTYQKNFQTLLNAWKMIQTEVGDWVLEIYGDGEDFSDLKDIIDKNKLKNVSLMGETNQIEKIYANAQLFVMSSRYEGLPMVLIEAQTFGLPIIAFDCPHGPAEVIDNHKNGILVENQNVEMLAQAMLEMMNNPQKRVQYSLQALEDSKKFQQTQILNDWKNIFERS